MASGQMPDERLDARASVATSAATAVAGGRAQLGGLRRRIEALMVPDGVRVVLQLDGLAECERRRRRA